MGEHDVIYKSGAWSLSMANNKPILSTPSLMVSMVEKLKKDIENMDPNDKKAQSLVNELLYHYCWKMSSEK